MESFEQFWSLQAYVHDWHYDYDHHVSVDIKLKGLHRREMS